MKCPKCGSDVRDVARFCQRCHATLRFFCPACNHEQRQGGVCEKCGANFLKYINAVVANKKDEADLIHDRFEQRTNLMTTLFWAPITGGISLLRFFFGSSRGR